MSLEKREKNLDPEADKAMWMNDAFEQDPEISIMREKLLPLTSGHSFANAIFTDTIQDVSVANRYEILNLISQHLRLLGLHYTADKLAEESGYDYFQPTSSDWETSDLRMITSLALGVRESPWDEIKEINHKFILEEHEEDYNSSPYREDPRKVWDEFFNIDLNSRYSSEDTKNYSTLICSTLRRVVVFLCTTQKKYLTDEDVNNFFLSLHSVTSSEHFFDILMHLFFLKGDHEKIKDFTPKEIELLRTNIVNLIKKWIFFHGLFIGKKTLKAIEVFLKEVSTNKEQFGFLNKFTSSVLQIIPSLTYGQKQGDFSNTKNQPIIPDPAVILSLDLKLFDPDPMEVARQLTLLAHEVFSSIHSMEFINAFSNKASSFSTPTLNEFQLFNDRVSLLVMETLAYSDDPFQTFMRAIEVGKDLDALKNYGTLSAFATVLYRADIQELCQPGYEAKTQVAKLLSKSQQYEESLLQAFSAWQCAIPNMKKEIQNQLENFASDNMPQFIDGLINWKRVRRLSERPSILYRFQNTKYYFYPIVQIQKLINRGAQHTEREIEIKINARIKERKEINSTN